MANLADMGKKPGITNLRIRAQISAWVEAYRAGETAASIAVRSGVMKKTVLEKLHAAGVEVRPSGRKKLGKPIAFTLDDVKHWCDLVRSGKTIKDVADAEGIIPGTMTWRVRRYGDLPPLPHQGVSKKYPGWSAKEVARNTMLRRLYGIDLEGYRKLEVEQDGRCGCCGGLPTKKGLVVDHDHRTGRVRQLLCSPCNTGIGLLGDDPERCVMARDYLLRHRALDVC